MHVRVTLEVVGACRTELDPVIFIDKFYYFFYIDNNMGHPIMLRPMAHPRDGYPGYCLLLSLFRGFLHRTRT